MSLIDLIKAYCLSDAKPGNWEAVAATLNARTVIVRNPKSWTFADLIGLVGVEGAALIGGTIQAAGASNPIFASAWIALSVAGLQLHSDDRQQMIDELASAGSWPDQLRDTVKSAGVTIEPLASTSAIECEAAWVAYNLNQRRQGWDTIAAEIRAGIESGILTDNGAIVSAIQTAMGV
jgi:hypothetical protein